MAKTNKFNSFRFGAKAQFKPTHVVQFNNPGTDKHFQSWLQDDEFVGRDSISVSRDLHVATGFSPRGGFHE